MLTNKIGQTSHKLNKVTYRNSITGWLWQRTQWLHSQKLTKNTHFLIWNLLPNYRDFAAIRLFWVQRCQKACDVKLSTPKLHWSTLTSKERRVLILNHQSIKVVVYNSQSVIGEARDTHDHANFSQVTWKVSRGREYACQLCQYFARVNLLITRVLNASIWEYKEEALSSLRWQ